MDTSLRSVWQNSGDYLNLWAFCVVSLGEFVILSVAKNLFIIFSRYFTLLRKVQYDKNFKFKATKIAPEIQSPKFQTL